MNSNMINPAASPMGGMRTDCRCSACAVWLGGWARDEMEDQDQRYCNAIVIVRHPDTAGRICRRAITITCMDLIQVVHNPGRHPNVRNQTLSPVEPAGDCVMLRNEPRPNSRDFIEISPAIEVFASGLARVECLNGNARLVFYVEQMGPDGTVERNVVLRLVLPKDAIGEAIDKTITTLGPGILRPQDSERILS